MFHLYVKRLNDVSVFVYLDATHFCVHPTRHSVLDKSELWGLDKQGYILTDNGVRRISYFQILPVFCHVYSADPPLNK